MPLSAQLPLPLRLPAATQLAIARARLFACQRYHCSLLPTECRDRQRPPPPRRGRDRERHEFCESGKCEQGLMVLAEAGLVRKECCPRCRGRGWVPRE